MFFRATYLEGSLGSGGDSKNVFREPMASNVLWVGSALCSEADLVTKTDHHVVVGVWQPRLPADRTLPRRFLRLPITSALP
jgi:hypothetical protein